MTHRTIAILSLLSVLTCRAAEPVSPALQLLQSDPSLRTAPHYQSTTTATTRDSTIQSIFYDGNPYHGHPTKVFAYLGIPAHAPSEKLPAMVLVHGGGGTAFANWVKLWNDRGYAAIAMDTCGCIPVHIANSKDWQRHADGGPPGWDAAFDQIHDDPKDQWPYHAVADILLADSLLRNLPDVDPNRIGFTGISWGGYLTCLASAADARFQFAVPVYGCGYLDECVWKPKLQSMPPTDRQSWLDQWDPRHFIGETKIPMLWVDSTNDKNYPLEPLQKTYDLEHSPRTLSINLRMRHGHGPGEIPEVIHAYADSFLKSAPPLPEIRFAAVERRSVVWTIHAQTKIVKAELLFTRDTGAWENRLWETAPATIAADSITAELPDRTTAYFLNVIDGRGANVSSRYEIATPAPQTNE